MGRLVFQLATRNLQHELMDDPALSLPEHLQALRGLQRVHWLTGTTRRLWNPMERFLREHQRSSLSVIDVGCGDASVLRSLWKKARSRGYTLVPIGCDFSARALELAQSAAAAEGIPLLVDQVDILTQALPTQADFAICTLFLHHFEVSEVKSILMKLSAAARHRVLVEDLVRSRLGYLMCLLGVHLLSRSRVVHVDGPLSVRAAFTIAEIVEILKDAGLGQAAVQGHWPERFLAQWQAGEHNA